ncbi:MAG: alpha-amylase family glycosyl hydrolase [Candidatus Cloacimonetes bacterium]|nr:alpha-amylase family glycosyl hydrolase [Candidatus Cloacimonadota bacterium]
MPEISFKYQAPTAGKHLVGITGDFTDWEILDLIDIGGIYILKLDVEPGLYRYKLIVDGIWIADPANPRREADPFGGENSILEVSHKARPGLTWEQALEDLSRLAEREGRYLEINRLAENDFELRFNWHPGLDAQLSASIGGREYKLYRLGVTGSKEVYHCRFACSQAETGALIRIKAADANLLYGAGGFSLSETQAVQRRLDLSALPVFRVPKWAREAIIYQIFPDRFRNGDPGNDPDFSEDYYADCRTPPPEGELLPPHREYFHLVEDWTDIAGLKQSPWLEAGKPDWWSFYGGDLAGVRQKLPYLVDLGINVIYFNPLWQARSSHKYDAADFKKVDPHFGSAGELQTLVKEAREAGIRVILDVAFNHTGKDFWAFRDCVDKGPESEYWNWYDWRKWPLPDPLPADFKPMDYYQCWWGIKDMPDLNFDLSRVHPAENYVKDIKQAVPNQALVDHILDCVRWWLLEIGIDGFRLDVPDEVPYWFWELFRGTVKSLKPDAWIIGEIWQSARGWVGPHYFDAVMNYAFFKDPVLEFLILGLGDHDSFRERIQEGLAQYPLQAAGAMMNLLGSHDTVRILELAEGRIERLKQALVFQMTFVGAPHIYYGDEIGMLGGRDPDNRRPFNWDWEREAQAKDLRGFYRNLIRLRKSDPLFTEGEFAFCDAPEGLLAWKRYNSSGSIFTVLNLSASEQDYSLNGTGQVLASLGEFDKLEDGWRIQPGSAVIWR